MWEQDDAERKGDKGPEQSRSAVEAAFLEHFGSDEVSQIVQKQVLSQPPCHELARTPHDRLPCSDLQTDILQLKSMEDVTEYQSMARSMQHGKSSCFPHFGFGTLLAGG